MPSVTVQLPLYNERYVAERIIQACAALDYRETSCAFKCWMTRRTTLR
ncbi:MAG: hypothetical protein HC853_02880 [Anaerolineae bacterium]|nr:hypothetical protein [Anaerolineae bacterium]